MKIVHINYSDRAGGAAIAAYRHNEAMNRAGLHSTLLVADRTDFSNRRVTTPAVRFVKMKSLLRRYWSDWRVNRLRPFATWSYAGAGFNLAEERVVLEADVVYLHWTSFGLLSLRGVQQLLALGKPVFWFMHDMWPLTGGCHYSLGCDRYKTHCESCPMFNDRSGSCRKRDLAFRQFERKRRLWAGYPNLTVLTPSRWLGDCARASALFGGREVLTCRNVIDTERYRPVSRTFAREMLGLPAAKKLILFGADAVTSPYKGWTFLKEALTGLAGEVECVVFGGCDPDRMKADIPVPVHFVGQLCDDSSLVLLYNAADVLVTPSLADNYPNVILEAMACGLPVTGFDTGGIPELIGHRTTGYLAEAGNSTDLRAGIHWVLFEADTAVLRSNARVKIETEASYERVLENHKELHEYITK